GLPRGHRRPARRRAPRGPRARRGASLLRDVGRRRRRGRGDRRRDDGPPRGGVVMGFAIPAALLALAFVAGPIVAHLVRRRGVDVRTLPTVRYLQKALSASSRKRRLIDLLLLAVRILAVVALALTAAQPFRALP